MTEVDLIESLMGILVQARQAKSLLHRVGDLEAQRDHWRIQAAHLKKAIDELAGRLDFLLVNYIKGEDDYFTFPDGTLFMVDKRLKKHIENKKLDKQE